MSAEYRAKQAALVAEHIKMQDIVVTTALIPGRKAPVLVSEDMVKTMKPGSVIVDMAVEQGGNCPLSEFGKIVEKYGVKIVGPANLPGELPTDASALFSRNLLNFITPMVDKETKALKIDTQRRGGEGHAGDPERPDRASLAQPRSSGAGSMDDRLAGEAAKLATQAQDLATNLKGVAQQITDMSAQGTLALPDGHMPFVSLLTIFALACFVGYYVVWRVTPALHSPLMAVTNAVSSVIIVGALLAAGPEGPGRGAAVRRHRRGAGRRQHLRRLHRHAPHAVDVQEEDPVKK